MREWIFISLLLFSQFAHANKCEFTEQSFSQWMMEYFRAPEPSKLNCSLSYYANSQLFQEHRDSRMPAAHFFAYALDENGLAEIFETLASESSLNERMFLLHVFWVKNTGQSKAFLEKATSVWPEAVIAEMVPKMLPAKTGNLLHEQPRSAGALDNLWAVFFATGKAEAVRQISSVLLLKDGSGMEILIGGAASWSLTANTRQYPEVRVIVEQLLEEAQGNQKAALEDVLANASGKNT